MFSIYCSCIVLLLMITTGDAIRCYQCSSNTDQKGVDSCGSYKKFDKEQHIPVECNSEESHTPGTFCMKVVQQSAKGFVWDGRWRQVIRRCASVASTGVTGVCNWGVYDNGIYWEECYCSEDACNHSAKLQTSTVVLTTILTSVLTRLLSFL